ncbi:MAG: hypothetical protein WAZ48_06995 [Lysobacteraceae bacterium]
MDHVMRISIEDVSSKTPSKDVDMQIAICAFDSRSARLKPTPAGAAARRPDIGTRTTWSMK